ncbi:MAG: tetratricopeptide repeat protein [Bacteroidetes bacterium]|jgi:tetratricopeptide (TPR) repeat protein|nr:tetratricopeptide repeat protein [Bacteroidota bacterium]MBT4409376.1 tetratricopeptide repeat protein [Bacteroidota bacterium]MBT5424883.1 tetratricopeptide repeat protein [Bacteroidota bacterium]MBT7463634.1 tetratricopeptide repeat protein [Bacteroidota bacterium]
MNLRTLLLVVISITLFWSCGNQKEIKQMTSAIDELEALVLSDTSSLADLAKAQELIQAYENYANALPEDTISAEYLYRAAEIAMNLQMAGRAIEYYQRILNNFPDFDKRSYCLFLEAFVYENQMQQYETAEKLYLEFIEKYPDHPLADDAEVSVQNMGKSLEELIQSWESQENK